LFSLLCVNTNGQTWLWGMQGTTKHLSADYGLGNGVATDKSGNVYTTGVFKDTLIFGADTLISKSVQQGGFFVTKYNTNGKIIWTKQGNTGDSLSMAEGTAIAVDASGNVYVAGNFEDTIVIGPDTLNAGYGEQGIFLVKYDMNGTVIWVRQANVYSLSFNACNAMALDGNANAYITGTFQDSIYFGNYSLNTMSQDVFLVKYDSNGNVIWAQQSQSYYTNTVLADNTPASIAADKSGNTYITGSFDLGNITFGTTTLLTSTNGEMFLAKFDPNGKPLWAKQGTSSIYFSADGASVALDKQGDLYLLGGMFGIMTLGSVTVGGDSNYGEIFIAKYNPSGTLAWCKSSTYVVNPNYGSWSGGSLAVDTLDHIYFTVTAFDALNGGPVYPFIFGRDTFTVYNKYAAASVLVKIDSSGKVLCGSAVNGIITSGTYPSQSVAVDSSGTYVYTGGTISWNTKIGPDKITYDGEGTPFVARWISCCRDSNLNNYINLCKGDSATLTAIGGVNYEWSTGATTSSIKVSPVSNGTYVVIVNNLTCSDTVNNNVTVTPYPIDSISMPEEICGVGKSTPISAYGGTAYKWMPVAGLSSDTIANPIAGPSSTTTYTVTIANKNCSVKDSVKVVVVKNLPIVTACCDTSIAFGKNVQLTSSGGSTYVWSPSAGLNCTTCFDPVASPTVNTTYTLTITSDSGCYVSQTITIDVSCGSVFVPNAFSPNNDGQNDYLYVRGDCIKTMQFEIFDRWGNKVFETTDKSIPWNGQCRGEAMNTGTYIYYLSATLYDGSTQTKKGNVALVR